MITYYVRAYCENCEALVYEMQTGTLDPDSKLTGESPHAPHPEHENPPGHNDTHTVKDFAVLLEENDVSEGEFYESNYKVTKPYPGRALTVKYYQDMDEGGVLTNLYKKVENTWQGCRLKSKTTTTYYTSGVVASESTVNFYTAPNHQYVEELEAELS